MRIAVCIALSMIAPSAAGQERAFETVEGGPQLRVIARVATGRWPKSVAVSPDGRFVVVCNFGRPDHDNVDVYEAATLERVGAIHFPGDAVESAFSPDGRTLYVSNFQRHRVEVIDFARREVRAEIAVGAHPKTVVVSRDGHTLYAANYFGRSVSVVDLRTGREVRRLPTGEHPRGMALLPDGTLLVAAFHGDTIHVFPDGRDDRARAIDVCRLPRDVLAAPDGRSFYVTCSLGHVGFYRLADGGRHFGIASTGRNPRSLGMSRDGRWIGVANFTSSDASIVDTQARTHRRVRIPGAHGIVGMAVDPGPRLRLYATSWDTRELIVLAE